MQSEAHPLIDRWGEPVAADAPESARRRTWLWALAVLAGLCVVGGVGAALWAGRVRALAEQCRAAAEAQQWDRVVEAARRWQWWQPGKAAPRIYLADAAYQQGDLERAVELLRTLPDSDALTPAALVQCSTLLFGPMNRPLEAAEILERVLRLDPHQVEARRRLIYFYAYTLQRRKMVHHAREAIHYDCDLPETYVYLMGQEWLSFANQYDENTKWFLGNPEEELFLVARAISRIVARGLDDTVDPRDGPPGPDGTPYHRQIIAQYRARFPRNLELLAYVTERAVSAGEVEEVARLLASAPAEAAGDHRFWRYQGWLHAARDELAEAETAYRNALALNCYDFVSRHQLAGVRRRFRRMEEVKTLEELAAEGKALRRDVLRLERVDRVPRSVLQRMAEYARKCGDHAVAGKLLMRLEEWPDPGPARGQARQSPPGRTETSVPIQPGGTMSDLPAVNLRGPVAQ